MKRRRFFLTVIADGLFVIGLAAIAVGIAMAGHPPAAVCVGGAEAVLVAVLLRLTAEQPPPENKERGSDH